jgi:NAD(P)H-hydrate epimerase
VIPIVTPAEMGAIDRAAPEPVAELVARAGAAAARVALDLLGGTYGRRVVVLAGGGNNGADGRDLAARLSRRGVRVRVVEPLAAADPIPDVDLVVDAVFGTGFHGSYRAPAIGESPVLAIDIPSGVDGLTGATAERVLEAVTTVTFAALKPGLLLAPGSERAGEILVADIGLDTSAARAHLVST